MDGWMEHREQHNESCWTIIVPTMLNHHKTVKRCPFNNTKESVQKFPFNYKGQRAWEEHVQKLLCFVWSLRVKKHEIATKMLVICA